MSKLLRSDDAAEHPLTPHSCTALSPEQVVCEGKAGVRSAQDTFSLMKIVEDACSSIRSLYLLQLIIFIFFMYLSFFRHPVSLFLGKKVTGNVI